MLADPFIACTLGGTYADCRLYFHWHHRVVWSSCTQGLHICMKDYLILVRINIHNVRLTTLPDSLYTISLSQLGLPDGMCCTLRDACRWSFTRCVARWFLSSSLCKTPHVHNVTGMQASTVGVASTMLPGLCVLPLKVWVRGIEQQNEITYTAGREMLPNNSDQSLRT